MLGLWRIDVSGQVSPYAQVVTGADAFITVPFPSCSRIEYCMNFMIYLYLATSYDTCATQLTGPRINRIEVCTTATKIHHSTYSLLTMAFAYSLVFAFPPRSPVKCFPSANVSKIAFSILSA